MSELFLIGGMMAALAAMVYVLKSSLGKKGGIPSNARAASIRGVADDYRRLS